MISLTIQSRDTKETPEALRAKGMVPAVFYGPKEPSTAIEINAQRLDRVWKEAGETTIVKLTGVGEDKDTLIHDIQFHPVTSQVLHADFYVIEKGKKVTLKVPLEFVGSAPAEKLGHIVAKVMHEVEIEVAPAELPRHLEVDLSVLETVGSHVTVGQIKLPPSAVLKTPADEIVVSIVEFKEEKAIDNAVVPAEIIGAAPAENADAAAATPAKKEEKK